MDILGKHLSFVNEQVSLQGKLARKFQAEPWRKELHTKSEQQFKALAEDLVAAQRLIDAEGSKAVRAQRALQQLTILPSDLEGLPGDLIAELSVSDSDRLEFTIIAIIDEAGGILSLDKILIALWHKTHEIHKRNTTTSRLYRMAQKGLIYNVPLRKGVYSTREISEQEAAKLFGLQLEMTDLIEQSSAANTPSTVG